MYTYVRILELNSLEHTYSLKIEIVQCATQRNS